jgi:hypothetical protein
MKENVDSKYRLYDGEEKQVGRLERGKNILLSVKDITQVRRRGKVWDERKDKKGRLSEKEK